ncbi:hypothetical protein AB4090_02240 [Acidithiobacillus sp. IBUN Pt1247-S3]|uniref:hypothetical protein n=1 Tax=Acidithiobacillus sp. IBUN Pt1247-S3 TaxID=3166642 RepID=UPI0034E54304
MKAVGDALRISRQAVWQWPEELPQEISDRLVGAAIRHGILPVKSGGDREGATSSSTGLYPTQDPNPIQPPETAAPEESHG